MESIQPQPPSSTSSLPPSSSSVKTDFNSGITTFSHQFSIKSDENNFLLWHLQMEYAILGYQLEQFIKLNPASTTEILDYQWWISYQIESCVYWLVTTRSFASFMAYIINDREMCLNFWRSSSSRNVSEIVLVTISLVVASYQIQKFKHISLVLYLWIL